MDCYAGRGIVGTDCPGRRMEYQSDGKIYHFGVNVKRIVDQMMVSSTKKRRTAEGTKQGRGSEVRGHWAGVPLEFERALLV